MAEDLSIYPGGDLVSKGLHDLHQSAITEEALLVLVASSNLRELGFEFPTPADIQQPYEHRLYERVEERLSHGAHAEYNALIQKLVSFTNSYRR